VLILTYGAILVFSLVTHKQLFVGGEADVCDAENCERPWPVSGSGHFARATIAVAWVSEFLVGAVEAAQHSLGVTETLSASYRAIVGNAAEHSNGDSPWR